MSALTRESLRTTVLRAEIMAMLHDVGKLTWLFVGEGTKQGDFETCRKSAGIDKKDWNLSAIHTVHFLTKKFPDGPVLEDFQKRLLEPLEDWLGEIPGTAAQALGTLVHAHHSGADLEKKPGAHPHVVPLAMYADTTDSMYSKGAGSSATVSQENDIFLTTPFGSDPRSLDRKTIEEDARALQERLTAALGGWRAWDLGLLEKKRREISDLLRRYGSANLAETRLPNNDVSLWQHSASVAGIFKALLAGCLLADWWDGLLREDELAHCHQRLAFLAIRWDTDAYLSHSLRSYEIVGRSLNLNRLANSLRDFVETDLCLGNEIYRDRRGICFLVPDFALMPEEGLFRELLSDLRARMEEECNDGCLCGELSWSVHAHSCGLRIGDFLTFWNAPDTPLFTGPTNPLWKREWERLEAGSSQVCPRCGVHPVKDVLRVGSSSDIACESCGKLSQRGRKHLCELGNSAPDMKGQKFLQFLDEDGEGAEGDAGSRVALIQGVFSLEALSAGSGACGWAHMLTPGDDGTLSDLRQTREKWNAACACQGEDEKLRGYFAKVLGQPAGFLQSSRRKGKCLEGWCGDDVLAQGLGARLRDYVSRVVFNGPLPADTDELVSAMVLWGARQHPAPSRLARVWEELETFTRWAAGFEKGHSVGTLGKPDWLRLPLTQDVTSFQLLVPAHDAWRVLVEIERTYAARFSKVRHFVPLHLSASVFRRKSPLYIAMDAARRFRSLSEKGGTREWKLLSSVRGERTTRLTWRTHDGREVFWDVDHSLPNRDAKGHLREDLFRTWYFRKGAGLPTHLSRLREGESYLVWPSTFDFEVLDASVRRYDIRYGQERRSHYMMRDPGPRPYPMEIIEAWDPYLNASSGLFKSGEDEQRQRKNAVELLAKLHAGYGWGDLRDGGSAAHGMARDILGVAMPALAEALLPAAIDGSFFDLCEWADFITK